MRVRVLVSAALVAWSLGGASSAFADGVCCLGVAEICSATPADDCAAPAVGIPGELCCAIGPLGDLCGGSSCATGLPGRCASGSFACAEGVLSCAPTNPPEPESCDGIDTDCDGVDDENEAGLCADDGNPCSEPRCLNGSCGFQPVANGAACDDGNPCTTGDVCSDGVCTGRPAACNDGNECTVDSCGAHGCAFFPVAEGTPCGGGFGVCRFGTCVLP